MRGEGHRMGSYEEVLPVRICEHCGENKECVRAPFGLNTGYYCRRELTVGDFAGITAGLSLKDQKSYLKSILI